jgi:glycogen debranching enzyme
VLFLAGSADEPGTDLAAIAARLDEFRSARRRRMEGILHASAVGTADARFDRAFAWCVLSLDALTMRQGSPGVYAGLPWFNNYWGRDTFIALPGAALVTGRFPLAQAILRAFAGHQELETSSANFGRIPNFYSPGGAAYNTADATPRFVLMAREYIDRSGDASFLAEMYPVIVRSIEGTIAHHTDSLGFLTHADAETWMDAAGPDGPWSPRGNRANDVQALWVGQLEAGAWFAARAGEPDKAAAWNARARMVREGFLRHFVHQGVVTDHLNPDGRPDTQLRPNILFTAPLLDPSTRLRNVATVATRLTYPYGVASLSQDDPGFHPYHEHPPFYPKDAAYHNGTVWTWLQGPLISELCAFGHYAEAWQLTRNTVHEILDRGAAGTQSELLDAVPHPGDREPRLSGTVSQAWNLAEFIRNWYDDYLGVRYSALNRLLTITPHLPAGIGPVTTRFPLGAGTGVLTLTSTRGGTTVDVVSEQGADSALVELTLPSPTGNVRCRTSLPLRTRVRLVVAAGTVNGTIDGKPARVEMLSPDLSAPPPHKKPFTFAVPTIVPGLRALSGPSYPLLSHRNISRRNPLAKILVAASDPQGDDTGVDPAADQGVAYTYPRDPVFVPGCFDLIAFSMRHDARYAYFSLQLRALSNPGWHPEYGFQLTEAAIAIDTNTRAGTGARTVPANAHFPLPDGQAYERLILVGGGVQVEDDGGKILTAYIPQRADDQSPIGDVANATIRFAIPLEYLGRPEKSWRFTILVGGQDDHGGAGIGEFRNVSREPSDWSGGGRMSPTGSNIYDTLTIP